jgi:nicotinate-nucleotide adenylyltransferase
MKSELRIGLFGGSFDPVHLGHIELARTAKDELGLDKVIFIPAWIPPHKLEKQLAGARFRIKMLSEALKPHKGFSISRFETGRKNTTYTYQTVAHFKKLYPRAKLFFIIGMDSLKELKTWKNIDSLAGELTFAAGKRRGVKIPLKPRCAGPVAMLKKAIPGVSSTRVRALAAEGRPLKGLVPEKVEKLIKEKGIYR